MLYKDLMKILPQFIDIISKTFTTKYDFGKGLTSCQGRFTNLKKKKWYLCKTGKIISNITN